MFTKKPNPTPGLEKVIEELLLEMSRVDKSSDQYAKMVDQLTKLYEIHGSNTPKSVSYDTLASIAGNLAGIVLILNYERAQIVTSKALGFVSKLK